MRGQLLRAANTLRAASVMSGLPSRHAAANGSVATSVTHGNPLAQAASVLAIQSRFKTSFDGERFLKDHPPSTFNHKVIPPENRNKVDHLTFKVDKDLANRIKRFNGGCMENTHYNCEWGKFDMPNGIHKNYYGLEADKIAEALYNYKQSPGDIEVTVNSDFAATLLKNSLSKLINGANKVHSIG